MKGKLIQSPAGIHFFFFYNAGVLTMPVYRKAKKEKRKIKAKRFLVPGFRFPVSGFFFFGSYAGEKSNQRLSGG